VRKFNPIEIPAKLQHLLPFKSKPKDTPKHRKTPVENRVPVLMQPSEKKTHAAIQQLRLLKHEKARKKKLQDEKKKKAYEAEKAKSELLTKKRQREERRVRYREEDKQKKRARR
jgi:ribosome biogenesis protein BMS1